MLGLSRYIYLHKGFTLGEANKVWLITYSVRTTQKKKKKSAKMRMKSSGEGK